MNYRHIYHAGNFADVFKHCVLVLLLESLLRKNKPFCYIDTHAGVGIYDLYSKMAQKTHEYLSGISRVLDNSSKGMPDELTPYLVCLKKLNKIKTLTGGDIHFYPGSPHLARFFLRPVDRMILMELHQEDILLLKKLYAKDSQVAVHHYDGYQGLKAFLPPIEHRGLVFIDPPFEQKSEFELILAALKVALDRWQNGIYAIWYPVKDYNLVRDFLRALDKLGVPHFVSEMIISKQTVLKEFVGSGMVIINPPWQVDQTCKKVLPWLWRVLSPNLEGGIKIVG